jgi:uncharacterized repeat protein (TIGR01451 family)
MKKTITVLALLLTSTCFAQVDLATTSQIQQYYTDANDEPKQHWVESKKVRPGKNLKLVISYHNSGDEAAKGLVLDNPVPADATYVEGTAQGNNTLVTFTVDNGKNYAPANALKVTENSVTRAATVSDYTGVRWTLQQPIAPGAKGFVEFQVKVK